MDDNNIFVTRLTDYAKDIFEKNPDIDGSVLVFAETDKIEKNAMWAVQLGNEENKCVMLNMIAAAMQYRNAERYAFLALAWMTEQTKGDDYIRPSEHPSRKEVLIISVDSSLGQNFCRVLDVNRDQHEKITGYDNSRDLNEGGGNFFGLLKLTIPAQAKLIAEKILEEALMTGSSMQDLNSGKKTRRYN